MSATSTSPTTAKGSIFETVTLNAPIIRGESEIATLRLRKPMAGDLRGLNLQDLMQMDVTSIIRLLPRISDPMLMEVEAATLPADDLAEIGGTLRGFFMTAAEKAAVQKLIEMAGGSPPSS